MNYPRILILLLLLLTSLFVHTRELNQYESGQLNKVSKLLEQKNYESALALTQPLLSKEKPHSTVFQYGCRVLTDSELLSEALNCWERAYKLYPKDINLAMNLSNILLQKERYQEVINILQPWQSVSEDDGLLSQVRYMLGYSYYQLTHYQAAIDILLSTPIKLHWWPLISYSQLALEEWQDAKNSALRWLRVSPDNQTAWQILARSEMGLNDPISGVVASDIANLLGNDISRTNFSLLGNLKAYNYAVECMSQLQGEVFTMQHFACAQYAWMAGEYEFALEFINKFDTKNHLNIEPHDEYYILQGQLFAILNQNDNAINAWEKVGKQELPDGSAKEIKYARQKRHQQQGKALLLVGQHYWLAQQWPEAKACYRKLAQTPGFELIAKAFENNLAIMDEP